MVIFKLTKSNTPELVASSKQSHIAVLSFGPSMMHSFFVVSVALFLTIELGHINAEQNNLRIGVGYVDAAAGRILDNRARFANIGITIPSENIDVRHYNLSFTHTISSISSIDFITVNGILG